MTRAEAHRTGRTLLWVENAAPRRQLPRLHLAQLWRHRELAAFFAIRDIKVRYKQAYVGVAWAVVQPLIGAFTFVLVFNRLAKVDVGNRSYFAFALVGFAVWTYFSTAVSNGSNSLLYNANLLTKIAFPRAVLPVAALLPPIVDLALGSILAVAAAVIAGDSIPLLGLVLAVPLGLAQLVTVAAGLALFFSALIVRFRDVAVLVSFGLQVVLLASPVAYPPDLVPSAWRTAVYVNPLAGCLGLIRHGLVGTPLPSGPRLLLSAAVAVIILLGGLLHFRRREYEFADII